MRLPVPDVIAPPEELGRVHLIGIGGAGLSGIARLLRQQGVEVSGSDRSDSAVLERLRAEGIKCRVGHDAENLRDVDTVIASTAVSQDNPELAAALESGLRVWPRSAGLMSTMLNEERIAVAGTHGKTTTTAMLTLGLIEAGVDVSFAIGAEVPALGTNARHGADRMMVVEADESDGAFLYYRPAWGLITNVDADHLDVWGSVEAYDAAFDAFVDTVEQQVIVGVDDPGARRLAERHQDRVLTVGFTDGAAVRGSELVVGAAGTTFTAHFPDGSEVGAELAVVGPHYATDALLALALGWRIGHDVERLAAGVARHTGASRRMEFKGEAGGVRVYDSYAHHPTEIEADLQAARAIAAGDRLVVAFQPHLVSRTRVFGTRMGEALSAADLVLVADIYLAREEPDPAVSSQLVAEAVTGPPAVLVGGVETMLESTLNALRPGDVFVTLGAGDITVIGPRVLAALGDQEQSDG